MVFSEADREAKEELEREVAEEQQLPFSPVTTRRQRKSKSANPTQPTPTSPNSAHRSPASRNTPISHEVGGVFGPLGGLVDGGEEQEENDAQEEKEQGKTAEVDEPADSSPNSPSQINLISDSPSQPTPPSPDVTRQPHRFTRSKNCASSQETDSEGGTESWRSGRRNVPVPSRKSPLPTHKHSASSKKVTQPPMKHTHSCDFCSLNNARLTERCAICKKQVCTRAKCGVKVSGGRHCLSCVDLSENDHGRLRSQSTRKKNRPRAPTKASARPGQTAPPESATAMIVTLHNHR